MKLWNVAVLLTVTSLVFLMGFGLTRNDDYLPSPLVGEPAPAFSLEVLDEDRRVSLDDLKGRPVVVNFWASWCLACIEEHPVLIRAWQRYRDRGVEMVGIVYQDTPENARQYIEKHGGGWTQLLDPKSRAAIDFGVYGVPETFFIGVGGTIIHKHLGPVTDSLMTDQIESMLAGASQVGQATMVVPGQVREGTR